MTTARQLQALATIADLGTSPPPSLRELAVAIPGGVSHQRAHERVKALERDGLLEVGRAREGSKADARALRLTPAGRELLARSSAPAQSQPDGDQAAGWRNRYVFDHLRPAIRVWAAHRDGAHLDRARGGGPGGRAPSLEDVLRVGRVLRTLELSGPQLGDVIAWARGSASIVDPRIRALVDRVTQRLQRYGIVARSVQTVAHRSSWSDTEGQLRETLDLIEVPEEIS